MPEIDSFKNNLIGPLLSIGVDSGPGTFQAVLQMTNLYNENMGLCIRIRDSAHSIHNCAKNIIIKIQRIERNCNII